MLQLLQMWEVIPADPVTLVIALAFIVVGTVLQLAFAPSPQDVEGPRKDGLNVPSISPGRPMNKVWGTMKVPCTMIWKNGLIETKHTKKVKGGKGGGKSQKQITYTYSLDGAYSICEGPATIIRRIWGNDKLIYDSQQFLSLTQSEIDAQVTALFDTVEAQVKADLASATDSNGAPLSQAVIDAAALEAATKQSDALRIQLERSGEEVAEYFDAIELHLGAEDQLPSPTIEEIEGAGFVPAYRGTCLFVTKNLQLADFGNTPPSIQAEVTVVDAAGVSELTFKLGPDTFPDYVTEHHHMADYEHRKIFSPAGPGGFYGPNIEMFETNMDTLAFTQTHDLTILPGEGGGAMDIRGWDQFTGYLYGWHGYNPTGPETFNTRAYVYDPITKTLITDVNFDAASFQNSPSDFDIQHYPVAISQDRTKTVVWSTDFDDSTFFAPPANRTNFLNFPALTWNSIASSPDPGLREGSPLRPKWMTGTGNNAHLSNEIWIVWESYDNLQFQKYTLGNDGVVTKTAYSLIHKTTFHPDDEFIKLNLTGCPFILGNGDIVYQVAMGPQDAQNNRIMWFRWRPSTETIIWQTERAAVSAGPGTEATRGSMRQNDDRMQFVNSFGEVTVINLTTGVFSTPEEITDAEATLMEFNSEFWDDVGQCLYAVTQGSLFYRYETWCWPTTFPVRVPIREILISLMTDAGFTLDNEYSVEFTNADLDIYGFARLRNETHREIIEDLQKLKPFDALESGDKIIFRLRDKPLAAIIRAKDMRANSPDPFAVTRKLIDDLQLPQEVKFKYQDPIRDYSGNSVIAKRETFRSNQTEEIQFTCAETPDLMKKSVFQFFKYRMVQRRGYETRLPTKYIICEPGDVVSIPYLADVDGDVSQRIVRITSLDLGKDGVLEAKFTDHIGSADDIDAVAFITAPPAQDDVVLPVTTAFIMDVSRLLDTPETTEGVYVAFGAGSQNWTGGGLFRDLGAAQVQTVGGNEVDIATEPQWVEVASATVPTDGGTLTTVPGAGSYHLINMGAKFIVNFITHNPQFASMSKEALSTSRDNIFLIGDEIVQAMTVRKINSALWEFSDLLRGLRGTERFIGTQSVGDRAVRLGEDNITRMELGDSDIGNVITVRGVSNNEDVLAATDILFTYKAAHKMQFAPEFNRAKQQDNGDLIIEVELRNRGDDDWVSGSAIPPDDERASWEIDFLNQANPGATVLRTVNIASGPTYTYSSANQTTDYGGTPRTIFMEIFALSTNTAIGRGENTLPVSFVAF